MPYCRASSVARDRWDCRLSLPAGCTQTPGTSTLEPKTGQLSLLQPLISWPETTGSRKILLCTGARLSSQLMVNQDECANDGMYRNAALETGV